jgi:glycosyltransferase involved in cell wall biosynthesis
MKKILVFIDWYLPGYKAGGPIRSMANMIASLKTNYSFYLICRNTDYLENVPYENIISGKWNKLSENESVYYIDKSILSIGLLKKLIRSKDFDMVYINGIYSFFFSIIPLILSKRLKFNKIIVAPRGMLSNQAFSAKRIKKKIFIIFAKLFSLYKNVIFHVTSIVEESDIQKLKFKQTKIEMLSNLAPLNSEKSNKNSEKSVGELKLVSIARISPEKNTLFSLECLAACRYQGKINFSLYGSIYNREYWKQCMEIISHLPDNIEVVYHGEIDNSKVINVLQNHHFLFLPSQGENFGHSILESFIAGCPLIISNKTPWHNLEEKNLGWDLSLEKEIFARIIQKTIDLNNEQYQLLSDSCKKYALNITNNTELKENYMSMFG